MKRYEAVQFSNDYEYKRVRDEERKADKAKRDQRRGKRDQWQVKED